VKNFEQFDFNFQPFIDERQIQELRSRLYAGVVSLLALAADARTQLSVAPNGKNPLPIPLILLAGGPAPWQVALH